MKVQGKWKVSLIRKTLETKVDEVSKGKATHLTEDAVHSLLNGAELGNTTLLTFDMLTQSTKSCKPSPTGRAWADVDLGLVSRASKMLVQGF